VQVVLTGGQDPTSLTAQVCARVCACVDASVRVCVRQ
jgi:hypothetical protein